MKRTYKVENIIVYPTDGVTTVAKATVTDRNLLIGPICVNGLGKANRNVETDEENPELGAKIAKKRATRDAVIKLEQIYNKQIAEVETYLNQLITELDRVRRDHQFLNNTLAELTSGNEEETD